MDAVLLVWQRIIVAYDGEFLELHAHSDYSSLSKWRKLKLYISAHTPWFFERDTV
jgi:hypothetical protein